MKILLDSPMIQTVYGAITIEDPECKTKIETVTLVPRNGPYTVFTLPKSDLKILDIMNAIEEGRACVKTYLEIEEYEKK